MQILAHSPAPVGVSAIADLNDAMRHSLAVQSDAHIMMTSGIDALCGPLTTQLGWHRRAELLRLIRDYEDFAKGNDPYGERDFGAFTFANVKCFWKIDYYNLDMSGGSENPADPSVTRRVLTIMRADEY